jgi:nucleoside-diphosphate-sugar epimerase
MQVILGAGGVIGNGLATELKKFTGAVRLAARNPEKVNPEDELVKTDLTLFPDVDRAVKGSDVAYLTAGLPYKTSVWQQQWPQIMRNTIDACKKHGVKLVFFDNLYLYGLVDGAMTESTPVNPSSKKGEVRAQLNRMLMDEIQSGALTALIARAADFYGPGATNTFVHPMIFEKLRHGKKASWLCNDAVPHSMIYTPDAVRGTVLLGNSDAAYGRAWHLPTRDNPPNGREFIGMVAKYYRTSPSIQVLKPWMLKMVGVFNPLVRESIELLYQNEYPYIVDSSDFESRFFRATSYEEGIRTTAAPSHQG